MDEETALSFSREPPLWREREGEKLYNIDDIMQTGGGRGVAKQ